MPPKVSLSLIVYIAIQLYFFGARSAHSLLLHKSTLSCCFRLELDEIDPHAPLPPWSGKNICNFPLFSIAWSPPADFTRPACKLLLRKLKILSRFCFQIFLFFCKWTVFLPHHTRERLFTLRASPPCARTFRCTTRSSFISMRLTWSLMLDRVQ